MTASMLNLKKIFLLSLIILGCSSANAVIIEYELNNLGGNSYEYTYSITNDDMALGIDQFSVYFDYNLYENLSVTASPVDWDSIEIQPDKSFPDHGLFDTLAFGTPLAHGETLSGFSVSFDWLGTGGLLPAEQDFELFDFDFNVIASGVTSAAVTTPVPTPSTISLMLVSLIPLALQLLLRRFSYSSWKSKSRN